MEEILSEPVESAFLKEDGREPLEEDRSTKKAKFREDCGVEYAPACGMSFKDKVMQSEKERVESISGSMEELVILDEDVSTTVEEGLKGINFSNRVKEELSKPWRKTVVVKLLGRPISFRNFCNRLESMWNFTQGFDVIDLENDFFLVKLRSGCDVVAVLTGGPWVMLGHYLSVQMWNEEFNCSMGCVHSIQAWIRLPGMPIHYYNKKVLRFIGQMVGKVVKIDYCTELAERGKFARIAVEIDLTKPLVAQFRIDGRLQKVEYECLPRICFNCGKFGHVKDSCPEIIKLDPHKVADYARARDEAAGIVVTGDQAEVQVQARKENNSSYGPWMMVGRKGRNIPHRNRASHGNNLKTGTDMAGSRFQILEGEDKEEITESAKNPVIGDVAVESVKSFVTRKTMKGKGQENSNPNILKEASVNHAVIDNHTPSNTKAHVTHVTQKERPKNISNPESHRFIVTQAATSLNPENHSMSLSPTNLQA
ncbi:uncharacterized protein LOC126678439 [Mercurialis annua]|uniref:uncharacterized protein LOC126678439 n=1 Tax=Mercurialis annua TaxID=3986 RepID=UPI0021606468|nr:uncharacterized protein LOC126678439 [Mercurialis annua]